MKKIFVLILVIATMVTYSQSSIVNPNANWSVAKTYPNGDIQNPNFIETTTLVYGFIGDTLIGDETWGKLYSTPDSNFVSYFTYLGNLKEENGIVLFMDTGYSIDTIYNFNLQIGDSVFYHFGFGTDYLQIENIDSIEISGEYYKRFHFEEPDYNPMHLSEMWIEGIGSIHGLLFPRYPKVFSDEIPDSLELTCYKIDNSIIWNNPFYDNCYVSIVLSSNEITEVQLKIFPNPVKNRLIIEVPITESDNYMISIFDLFGKTISKKTYNKTGIIEINLSSLKSGLYILQIEFDNKKLRQKFVKE